MTLKTSMLFFTRLLHALFVGHFFPVCKCIGQWGSYNISILELHILGLHAGYFWRINNGQNSTRNTQLLHRIILGSSISAWQKVRIALHEEFLSFRKAPDTFNFLRHVMRAIWSVRPKCSHRYVTLKETSLKPVQILKAHNQKVR